MLAIIDLHHQVSLLDLHFFTFPEVLVQVWLLLYEALTLLVGTAVGNEGTWLQDAPVRVQHVVCTDEGGVQRRLLVLLFIIKSVVLNDIHFLVLFVFVAIFPDFPRAPSS